jgi:hypothetical protein
MRPVIVRSKLFLTKGLTIQSEQFIFYFNLLDGERGGNRTHDPLIKSKLAGHVRLRQGVTKRDPQPQESLQCPIISDIPSDIRRHDAPEPAIMGGVR